MATRRAMSGVRVPAGSRDWFVPLSDPRARSLRRAGVRIAGISEVRRGFDWRGPGATHLVLGTIDGVGRFEAGGRSRAIRSGELLLSPAGVPRRYATRAPRWRFLAIRLVDGDPWQHLRGWGVEALPDDWLRRLVAPVEGMLAEHAPGDAIPMQPPTSRSVRESPAEYLSRYADRLGQPVSDDDPTVPPPDPFQLHATILRSQLQAMLAPRGAVPPGDEAIALAGLWSRVREQPRGPWDTDALASSLGVSRATLYRMVKRHHGMSPGKVVEGLRMEEARRLLSESQHPIEVIAEQVGYASAFSFSASFKRVAGEPPSRFRAVGEVRKRGSRGPDRAR
jgi:AraC-like DNA-binding protein